MDIQNIAVYSNHLNGKRGLLAQQNFLSIGKKGQVVQGTISSVGEPLTIQFNGIEVAVAKNSISQPKEGQVRDFLITNVSKDSIVLKDMSDVQNTQSVQGMKRTSVAAASVNFEEYLSSSRQAAQDKSDKTESLAILNGEDYEVVEESEGSFEKTNQESIERAVERIKAQKEWKSDRMEDYHEQREMVEESRKLMQAESFSDWKSEAQIRYFLEEAGIPTTQETITKVMAAMEMGQEALTVDDHSKLYIVGQELMPTIDNLYQGKFFTTGTAVSLEEGQGDFEAYREQIEQILQECGYTSKEDYKNAQWLFANELPINGTTMEQLSVLDNIQNTMTPEKVMTQIIYAMLAGAQPKDAILDDSCFVVARNVVNDFRAITDGTLIQMSDYVLQNATVEVSLDVLRNIQTENTDAAQTETVIPIVYTSDMTQEEMMQVTLKRQLAEIQQKLTVSSAVEMEQKGIHVDTASLDQIIEELRDMENAYYSRQIDQEGNVNPDEVSLLQETLSKKEDIANAHAAVLGGSVRQRTLLTMNELHAATGSRVFQKGEWLGTYETVSTQVRRDLGDSIQKAFASIPAILEEIGLEDTTVNERAARILGYNDMEITPQNIQKIKEIDQKVNRLIDNCKPTTVLSLIREGKNPLDMPIDELNQKLEQIQQENGVTKEEKYSRFIWQLEKSGKITEEERSSFIGMYRLLNQIQSMDGAQIGAVLETNTEVTLGNLLTQGRTKKGHGVDTVVDDEHGFHEVQKTKESITDQIEKGFATSEYYRSLMDETAQEITPEILQEMTDGDMEVFLDTSVEKLWDKVKNTQDNNSKKEYFEEQAAQIRETFADSEAAQEYIANLQIENTIENVIAAKNLLENGYQVYAEAYKRRNVLNKTEKEDFEELTDDFVENMENEEDLEAQCQKAEKIIEDVLAKSYEQADITIEDLKELKMLSRGMHFMGALRQAKSYDIPIRTQDGITSLNLTIIHGADESGKIQVSMEDEIFGDVSMEIKMTGEAVRGLVLCNQRQGYEALKEQKDVLQENLEQAGYQVKDISYGMDFKSRNEMLKEERREGSQDTKKMYQVAKMLVRSIVTARQKVE